ncbi:GlsB/YeaQ/YmgE family stress response membrane protein [Roseovarius spongiae]|uniref:GlsB/YeaQ/YmgE family stress response membrane protein n=1 Tax=Roseovarius spongiae TaxID=2320272 RepID=A0A3A8ATQ1_9RHOB|nr:GlsB/YeaQ/YmgE family stress response membrane protein [Roseovarius spongiae]RKF14040.1 GlsB/YeaQ/YmgE family stress response membrane protein [Roseovarius spongiae]
MGIGLIGAIIVGGLAGWIASMIMKADTGLLANIGLGIVGAVVLNFILSLFNIYARDAWLPQLVVGLVGACLLIWLWRALRGRA